MNKIRTQTFKTSSEMDNWVNDLQEHFKVFATQTHIGHSVNGEPQFYTATVFYKIEE